MCVDRSCDNCRRADRLTDLTKRVHRLMEDRAAGLGRWGGAAAALRWYVATYITRSSARALPIDPDRVMGGGGGEARADVRDRQYAAVAYAIKVAEEDDRARNAKRPAPLRRWVMQHFAPGEGRSYAWIAESEGWDEGEVSGRVERAVRVIGKRLRAEGWIGGRAEAA